VFSPYDVVWREYKPPKSDFCSHENSKVTHVVVGIILGATDGSLVGISVGSLDGLTDGVAEGAFDGLVLGTNEGISEGSRVGMEVGIWDGEPLGRIDNSPIGHLLNNLNTRPFVTPRALKIPPGILNH
jgi:hypothetical protein